MEYLPLNTPGYLQGELVGILTDKDIAYRVVATGLNVRTTAVSAVMTPDPISVSCSGNRNEALNIMVTKKFRHLPVLSEIPFFSSSSGLDENASTTSKTLQGENAGDTDSPLLPPSTVVGLLDITKCVFDRLDELHTKATDDERILVAMELLEERGMVPRNGTENLLGQVVDQIQGCPSVGSILYTTHDDHVSATEEASVESPATTPLTLGGVPEAMMKSSVRDVAQVMKEHHHTAVIILSAGENGDRVAGILTTKDIVLRVLAANLDPITTSAVRVMVCLFYVMSKIYAKYADHRLLILIS